MADLKLVFVLSCFIALVGLSHVEAASRYIREVEAGPGENNLDKVQHQLMTAFDSLRKSMDELASKFNTDEIVQGVQGFTTRLETYAKQAADQFSATAEHQLKKAQELAP